MSEYIPYTDEQITRANNTDIPAMLESLGHRVKREGANWRWISAHDSLMIKGNRWYRNSTQCGGGGAINFCKQYLDMDFKESMNFLLGGEHEWGFPEMSHETKPKREFILPPANKNMRRVFAYLTKERCIDPDIVSSFAHARKIYEDDKYHNVVFVGCDENDVPRFACKRGTVSYNKTPFRRDVAGSDKKYGFSHNGSSDKLYIFEAPVDMLSYISLHKENWEQHSYLALGGIAPAALTQFLTLHKNIHDICLCLDNDRAGHEAIQRIGKDMQTEGYTVSAYLLPCKDWNQYLQETKGVQKLNKEPEQINAPALSAKYY